MAQISRPQGRETEDKTLMKLIGMGAGAYFGGEGGRMAGAQIGGQVADATGGLASTGGQMEVAGAAQRRMQPAQTMPMQQVDDPIQTVEKARVAVANLPPDQQQLFAPALNTGYAALKRQQNGVA